MTRFEATPPGMPEIDGSVQPVLDFWPSDGRAALLGVSCGADLYASNIFGAGGAGASLGSVTNIAGADITVASNFSSAHMVIDVLGYY